MKQPVRIEQPVRTKQPAVSDVLHQARRSSVVDVKREIGLERRSLDRQNIGGKTWTSKTGRLAYQPQATRLPGYQATRLPGYQPTSLPAYQPTSLPAY